MATGGFKFPEVFAHRLPTAGPEIATLFVTEINVTAGLVHGNGIKPHTDEAPHATGFVKTVSAGIIGNDGAVFGGTEIIAPGFRCVGAVNYIFMIFIVKMSKFHLFSLSIFLTTK